MIIIDYSSMLKFIKKDFPKSDIEESRDIEIRIKYSEKEDSTPYSVACIKYAVDTNNLLFIEQNNLRIKDPEKIRLASKLEKVIIEISKRFTEEGNSEKKSTIKKPKNIIYYKIYSKE